MQSFCFWSICIRSASLVRSVPVPAEGPLDVGHETVQSTSESPHHNTRNGCPAVSYFRRVLPPTIYGQLTLTYPVFRIWRDETRSLILLTRRATLGLANWLLSSDVRDLGA
jgi:hypothetical protein